VKSLAGSNLEFAAETQEPEAMPKAIVEANRECHQQHKDPKSFEAIALAE
jgi:hypothetical protein